MKNKKKHKCAQCEKRVSKFRGARTVEYATYSNDAPPTVKLWVCPDCMVRELEEAVHP